MPDDEQLPKKKTPTLTGMSRAALHMARHEGADTAIDVEKMPGVSQADVEAAREKWEQIGAFLQSSNFRFTLVAVVVIIVATLAAFTGDLVDVMQLFSPLTGAATGEP